jgi:outer membrane protein OmpA-like peptidoglycan-associated protein
VSAAGETMHHARFSVLVSLASVAALAGSVTGAGCAAHPAPPELVDARVAYARASAVEASPDELAEAKRFLDAAERWHLDEPRSEEAKNLAYIAQRKAQIAEADARTVRAEIAQARDLQALYVMRREQLAAKNDRLEKSEEESVLAARPPGSRGAKEAVDRLGPFAAVSASGGRMTVTIEDSVLFEGDTAKLMATARDRLDRVAQALQALRGRSISVKGYVNASGDNAHDIDLSRRRADAVRQYLVMRGIVKDRVRAFGLGAAPPVAGDTSPLGHHETRRIEVVVEGLEQDTATH